MTKIDKENCETNKLDENVDQNRRDLLKGFTTAAVVGGIVATGLSTKINANEKQAQSTEQQPLQKGYHETQHIRDYFDSL